VVDEAALAQSAGTSRMKLVNDLEATAHGVLGLGPSALARLQAGKPHKANMALIAAGTGLGEVVLPWDGRRHHTVPSEGGHVDFAPRNDLEIDLWKFLRRGVRTRQLRARRLPGPGSTTSTGSWWPATARPSRSGCARADGER
jgi:glucokinase